MSHRDFAGYVDSLERYGERVALTRRAFIAIEHVTFTELANRARQTATFLGSLGVRPGDRVLVVARNSPEWVELLLGTLLIGAVLVPVDATSSLATIERAIEDTRPVCVFDEDRTRVPERAFLRAYALADLAQLIADRPNSSPLPRLDPDAPALIVFTSGTTASPKGVVLSQGNVLSNIEGIRERITVRTDWRLLSVLPLSHTYELTGTLTVLAGGGGIFYIPQVTPSLIVRGMSEYRINTLLAIPQLLSIMLSRIRQSARDEGRTRQFDAMLRLGAHVPIGARRLMFRPVIRGIGGHLRLVVTGGAPIPLEVARAWEAMGVRAVQGYGLTETAPILTVNPLRHHRLDSPGRPLANVELRISSVGEIEARGPNVFREYWENPEATREAFTEDGWFRTGDVGRLRHGWLSIEGRLKFAIVRSSGLKVFPEDVELVTETNPVLRDSCVVGVGGVEGEEVVAVVISGESDSTIQRAVDEANAALASFQHIDAWRRWPTSEFPRTRLLKVDRRSVQDWALTVGAEPPGGPTVTESTADPLCSIIRRVLNSPVAPVSDDDQLAHLGLDSLRRLSVVSLLEEQMGVAISDDQMRPDLTVRELRQLVATAPPGRPEAPQARWTYWPLWRAIGTGLREVVIDSFVRHWVTVRVEGVEALAGLTTPAIVIFNHSDDFDGPVLYRSLPPKFRRRLAVATADDVLRAHRILAVIVRLCFAGFSFARTEPLVGSLEYVGELVDRGWNVAIAPEGRISTDGRLQDFKSGIGLLAVNLDAPVIPIKLVDLAGTVPLHAKWPRKHSQVTVRIGRPMTFSRGTDYVSATEELHRTMEDL